MRVCWALRAAWKSSRGALRVRACLATSALGIDRAMKTTRSRSGAGMVIGIAIIVGSIALGWWQHEVGMQRGFDALQKSYESSQTKADPQIISGSIDHALYAVIVGAGGVLIGLVILVRSLLAARRSKDNSL